MKKSKLKNCPEWLMLAETKNEDVEINSFGQLTWFGGKFLGGEFRGGYFRGGEFLGGEFRGCEFLGGEFRGGKFLGGEFRGGYFRGGEFRGGYFRDGYFLGGEFRGGYFLDGEFRGGYFLGGEFRGGEFLGGEFRGGEFLGGEFLGGLMMPNCKWIYGQDCEGNIIIGCKRMKIDEWDKWFAGSDEFETKRGTLEFKKIQACFEATKAFVNFLK